MAKFNFGVWVCTLQKDHSKMNTAMRRCQIHCSCDGSESFTALGEDRIISSLKADATTNLARSTSELLCEK